MAWPAGADTTGEFAVIFAHDDSMRLIYRHDYRETLEGDRGAGGHRRFAPLTDQPELLATRGPTDSSGHRSERSRVGMSPANAGVDIAIRTRFNIVL